MRDWRSWLDGLDFIRARRGVENITGAHWFAFVHRADVPLRWANYEAAPALGGTDTSPNDVMLLVKQFMSDADLMQPPELMLTAGASAMLQPLAGPSAWDYREDIEVNQIERLCKKVELLCPSRAPVIPYLQEWMARPRVSTMPVPEPVILKYLCRDRNGADLTQAMATALQRPAHDLVKPLLVKRRRCTPADHDLLANVTFEQYVTSRNSQGVDLHTAVREWNGRQALLWSQ